MDRTSVVRKTIQECTTSPFHTRDYKGRRISLYLEQFKPEVGILEEVRINEEMEFMSLLP